MNTLDKNTDKQLIFNETVMSRRFLASYGLLRVAPELELIMSGATGGNIMNLDALSREQKHEIRKFAMSYTEKIMITGNETELWAIIPSMFPASSFCVALRFCLPPTEALRLLREDDGATFVLSEHFDLKAAKMSARIRGLSKDMISLCKNIRECFCDVYQLDRCASKEERIGVLRDRCRALSYFTGCPIDLSVEDGGDFDKIDLSVLCAFLYTVLACARNNAPRREACVKLISRKKESLIEVSFEGDGLLCMAPEMLEWSKTANDKGMLLSIINSGARICASLCPMIDESVYTEIKQRLI